MSILNKDSVLILGAGVSAPFGISLGGDMIGTIRKGIAADNLHINGQHGLTPSKAERLVSSTYGSHQGFWKLPFYGTALQGNQSGDTNLDATGRMSDMDKLTKLIDLLDDQTSETIDDFIVENPDFGDLLKACIAAEIMGQSYEFNNQTNEIAPKNLAVRSFEMKNALSNTRATHRNWVHLLINLVRQGIRSNTIVEGHKVRIISFNYDGILEHVLEKQFQNTGSKYGPYTDYIEIIHPHGICGKLNQSNITSAGQLYEWSQNISVVNESNVNDPAIINARKTAKDWIEKANQVYAVGFAFSAPNCEMLGMREGVYGPDKHLYYCNYDGNQGVTLAAEKCTRFRQQHPTCGTPGRPISVEDWFYGGYLGEFSA